MQGYHRGQNLTEYSIVLALALLGCIGGLQMLNGGINKGFGSIFSSSGSSSALKSNVSNSSTDNSTSINDTALQTNQLNGLSGSPDPGLEKDPNTVLTAGSLGDENELLADSDQLMAIAAKYKDAGPDLFNQVVQLGNLGKALAAAMDAYEKNPNDKHNYENLVAMYKAMGRFVKYAPSFKQLSPQDQAEVMRIYGSIKKIASEVLDTGGGVANASTTVDQSSDQVVECGQNEKCN